MKRSIEIDIDTARKWYIIGGDLKKIALLAFSEKELSEVKLPKTWEEFCKNNKVIKEFFINLEFFIKPIYYTERHKNDNKNLLPSREDVEAYLALMQLHQLRNCYRQGWKPNWNDPYEVKYVIKKYKNNYEINKSFDWHKFLSFQSEKIAEEFIKNFKNLLDIAGDLTI